MTFFKIRYLSAKNSERHLTSGGCADAWSIVNVTLTTTSVYANDVFIQLEFWIGMPENNQRKPFVSGHVNVLQPKGSADSVNVSPTLL